MTELKQFLKISEELTVNDKASIILRGSRIVMPGKLRERAVNIAHEGHQEGHQGIVKIKKHIREKIWFPCQDDEMKKVVSDCLAWTRPTS